MRLKSFFHFGYTKSSVDCAISQLQRSLLRLDRIILEKDEEIERLKNELSKSQAKEEIIQEAILDAKHLSKKLLDEAQSQAEQLMYQVEENLTTNLDEVNNNLIYLKGIKDDFISKEKMLQAELKNNLNRYLALIDENVLKIENKNQEIDTKLKLTEHIIGDSQKFIQLGSKRQNNNQKTALENLI